MAQSQETNECNWLVRVQRHVHMFSSTLSSNAPPSSGIWYELSAPYFFRSSTSVPARILREKASFWWTLKIYRMKHSLSYAVNIIIPSCSIVLQAGIHRIPEIRRLWILHVDIYLSLKTRNWVYVLSLKVETYHNCEPRTKRDMYGA